MPERNDNQLFDVLKYLLKQLAVEQDLDTQQLRMYKLEDFLDWLPEAWEKFWTEYQAGSLVGFTEALQISDEEMQFINRVLRKPYTCATVLVLLWPALALAFGEPLHPRPTEMLFSFVVHFESGPPMTLGQRVQLSGDQPFAVTEGHILGILNQAAGSVYKLVRAQGMRALAEANKV